MLALFFSIKASAQNERADKKFVSSIVKDLKNNRLEKIVDRFVDSAFIDKLVDQMLLENPKYVKNFDKEKIEMERAKAKKDLRKSVEGAYRKLSVLSKNNMREVKLKSIEIKKRKQSPISSFRAIINVVADTTKVSLRIDELTYDKQAKKYLLLSNKIRMQTKNADYYRQLFNKEAAMMAAEEATEVEIKEAADAVSIAVEEMDQEIEEVLIEPFPDDETYKQDEILTVVEKMPEFPGGEKEMYKFILKNLRYPEIARENNIQGMVFVSFVVSKEGSLRDIKVLRGIGFGCDEEAMRVILRMPKWEPGTQRGKPVDVRYTLPFNFKLK